MEKLSIAAYKRTKQLREIANQRLTYSMGLHLASKDTVATFIQNDSDGDTSQTSA